MSQAPSFNSFRDSLQRLVESFHDRLPHLQSVAYDESSLRTDFLNPFWRALGWDIENRAGLMQALREIQVEPRVDVAGKQKRADYLFRTDGIDRFVCEAKRPGEDLSKKHAYQTQRYAFNLRLLVATLTNFRSFEIFVVGGKPDQLSPWDVCKQWHYEQYIDKAQEIWDLFARENVALGSLEKYVAALPKKPVSGKARQGWLIPPERVRTVDAEFLAYIDEQRQQLATALVRDNPQQTLTAANLNECIQRILDRILFVRICEDRDIDTGKSLERILADWEAIQVARPPLYSRLVSHFIALDTTFNGALFRSGHPSENLRVADEFLANIIRDLSSEDSPYLFSTLPVEILGSVYEQFIGKVVVVSRGGRVKIEDKPEVRNAGGVYYTPRYVVDFIVEKTVGSVIKGKSPKDISKIRVLDPSCGSGSFLLRAFERICQEHVEWYQHNHKHQGKDNCYSDGHGNLHLTTHLKRQIMLNNIFGVDVDYQAVEVTMLSLYLKILEGETRSTLGKQRVLFPKETFLPDLGDNIKCGNSLIETDFDLQTPLLDDWSPSINAFDWHREFPNIMTGTGFDVVVGNPPWGAVFDERQREYLSSRYSGVVARMTDSYIYFIDQAIRLLGSSGLLGFIVPSTILNQVDAGPVRKLLLKRGMSCLISLGQGIFGPKPLNTSTIFISEVRKAKDNISLRDLTAVPLALRKSELADGVLETRTWRDWAKSVTGDPHSTFFVGDHNSASLLARLRQRHSTLREILTGDVQRGVTPDVVEAHVIDIQTAEQEGLEKELLQRSVSGPQIKRYMPWQSDRYVIYTTRETKLRNYPRIEGRLRKFRTRITCKEVGSNRHPWWSLHRPRDPGIFFSPKFIGLTTSKTIELIFDDKDSLVVTDAMYVFSAKTEVDPWFVLAVMQSSLFLFLYRVANQGESRVIPQIKAAKLQSIPFPTQAEKKEQKQIVGLAQRMMFLNEKLQKAADGAGRNALLRQLRATDELIDSLVCQLYGLTEPESALVKGRVPLPLSDVAHASGATHA